MRAQQAVLGASGTVALLAGVHQALTGVAGVRGHVEHEPSPSLDSELRFYGAWYAAAGVAMLREAADPVPAHTRLLAGAWSAAVTGRLLSMRATGRPPALFVALTVAEVAVSAALLLTEPSPTPER